MMSDPVVIALITGVSATLTAITTGVIATIASRRNKKSEAEKTNAEADHLSAQVKVLYLENEKHLLERLALLEKDRAALVNRLEAVEMELLFTKKKYEDDLAAERRKYEAAVRVQESLENELGELREMIDHLTKENASLHSKVKQLASRVETGELGDRHKREAR